MILGLIYILFLTYLMGKASSGIHSLDDFFGCLIGGVFMLGIASMIPPMVLSFVMPALQIACYTRISPLLPASNSFSPHVREHRLEIKLLPRIEVQHGSYPGNRRYTS
jgi:hypothetical protein